jgi:type IV secretion system protein VirB5
MLSRKKKVPRDAGPDAPPNPYADAQNVWIERYGSHISQAYNWRLLAILEAVALIAAVCGLVYIAQESKLVPYVVAVDKIGQAVAVQPADRASTIDPRVVRAMLANWIVDARSVSTDRIIERSYIDAVYNLIPADAASLGYLNDYYSNNGKSPYVRATKETDQIAIVSILPVSATSYEVQWTETLRDFHGHTTGTQSWAATLMIAFRAPTDEATILKNPLGLYITSVNWALKA